MRMTRLGLLALCTLMGSRVWAVNSIGFDGVGGDGASGFDVTGSLDIKPTDVKNPYETSLIYAHQHSKIGTESKTNQLIAGMGHMIDDNWDAHGDLNFWKDQLNNIHYVGPTAGFMYTWTQGPEGKAASSDPLEKNETDTEPPPPDEIAALSFNADLFFYGTEVEASSTTRRVFDPARNRFVLKPVPPQSSTLKVTQFHPSATFEKPFWDSQVTPYMTAGHYFYSRNPADIEALSGRPRFASSVDEINGLVGGFFNNNGEIGGRFMLPWDVDGEARLGAEQEITTNLWSTTQGLTLSRTFVSHYRFKLDWSRVIQDGVSDDLFTTGLTYLF